MAAKKTLDKSKLQTKARQVLAFAEEQAKQTTDLVQLYMALFGVHGKATKMFPTDDEWKAFCRTPESKRIDALIEGLPCPPIQEMDEAPSANGTLRLRLPRSVHAKLLAEAQTEGVSLNQLCLSKLVTPLREVV